MDNRLEKKGNFVERAVIMPSPFQIVLQNRRMRNAKTNQKAATVAVKRKIVSTASVLPGAFRGKATTHRTQGQPLGGRSSLCPRREIISSAVSRSGRVSLPHRAIGNNNSGSPTRAKGTSRKNHGKLGRAVSRQPASILREYFAFVV